ncbi:MAG: hypothetical protein ACFB6S_13025 [Geminicoccaceae bacterium]
MGLLDAPAPVLSWLDSGLSAFLPEILRLVLWGFLGAVLSMTLYSLVSPQRRLTALKASIADARRDLAGYDGEFEGLWPRIGRLLGLSFRQLGLVLLPALIASLPVLALLVWTSNQFGYHLPSSGTLVSVSVEGPGERVSWQGEGPQGLTTADQVNEISWPGQDEALVLVDPSGEPALWLPLEEPAPVVHKRFWWNGLIGNPAGYLPDEAPVDAVHFDLPRQQFLPLGPSWLRGGEAVLLISLLVVSLIIKVAFRIV